MFLNFRIQSVITFFFYLILIGVSILSLNNLMEESTTFDEAFVGNEAKFPSFTLCPFDNSNRNKSIESFEDVAEEIKNVKRNFKIRYYEYKPYEEMKIVNETYNQTLKNNWYFAPRISNRSPYETVICLIMAPFRDHKLDPERINGVSCLNCETVLNYVNHIVFSHTMILVHYLD